MFLNLTAGAETPRGNADADRNNALQVWKPGISRTTTPQPQLVSDDYIIVTKAINDWQRSPWCGNPSIVEMDSGRLLILLGGAEERTNSLFKSDDQGKTWQNLVSLKVQPWPNLFKCKSGLYIIYPTSFWNAPNRTDKCMEIIRSTDDGNTWSTPGEINVTRGLAMATGNSGVLVSKGRVTCSFEIAPTMCDPVPQTQVAEPILINESDLDKTMTWVKVQDASAIPVFAFTVLTQGDSRLHCRIMEVDSHANKYLLKPENWRKDKNWTDRKYNVSPENSKGPWRFAAGARLEVAAGTLGNKRDFWAMAVDAPDDPDFNLCDSKYWRISNPVVNPVFAYSKALYDVFGLVFDYRDDKGIPDERSRWAGWLEGACVRLEHKGSSGKILNLLRMEQQVNDSLSGRVLIDDSGDELKAEFERIGFDEGLGVTHCYVEYDRPSSLYWMVSNVNRNSTRDVRTTGMKAPWATQERSNLALFYSRNAADWFMVGMVAYSRDWAHSYHYPHFTISGDDLLVVARSHVESPLTEKTMNQEADTADNHDGNAITFHRVRDFRKLVNRDFIDYIE